MVKDPHSRTDPQKSQGSSRELWDGLSCLAVVKLYVTLYFLDIHPFPAKGETAGRMCGSSYLLISSLFPNSLHCKRPRDIMGCVCQRLTDSWRFSKTQNRLSIAYFFFNSLEIATLSVVCDLLDIFWLLVYILRLFHFLVVINNYKILASFVHKM